ncbi:PIG-L family deacetylase [Fervidobacterium pennivorans subsp. shakshaketiis]|uniref:PIG-L deacetylase family protein n=1 Tax=Fervidobacterium pennivorans TaxID=93466 RepID=UPI00355BB07D
MITTLHSYLFIGAHPDDIEIWAGGLILRILRENPTAQVHCVVLTDGSAGYATAQERYEEAMNAAKMMKVSSYEFLNLKDGSLHFNNELPNIIANLIRKYKPDLLITHPRNDRHPDHAAVGTATDKALFLAMVTPEFLDYEPHFCKNVLRFVSDPFNSPKSKVYVDISKVYEQKKSVISNFKTQLGVLEPYLQLNEFYGGLMNCVAAEVFEPEVLMF